MKAIYKGSCCSFVEEDHSRFKDSTEQDGSSNQDQVMQRMRLWSQKNVVQIKLCEYSEQDHADGINHLCEKQGAVVYINFLSQNGLAPLHMAAMRGAQNAGQALINHGADIHLKSEAGYTAPQYARANGHNGMANFLQNYNVATRPRFSRSPAKAASAIFKGTASASSPGSGSQGTPPIPSRSGDRASSEPVPLRKELGPPPEIESSTRRISFEEEEPREQEAPSSRVAGKGVPRGVMMM
eukprot:CAMPEP_0177730506 /NCGR_PEP_ID=MMETSP0484_2-20121128/22027_1 /TAXON_ID=354590 /ORGANISM="Rhodomonas lens, Strain RHODO" /LENGTH=239 /DNA_ID=CAMNT_0019243503 /DNA_START=216 /DNA_END=932 /DNA_ORIENTATION=+